MDILTSILGGLGLFFIGIKAVSSNLQQLAGRRARNAINRLTARPLAPVLLGVLLGALTQSTNAVTVIATSMLGSGLLTMRRAVPVVAWSNVGTSGLVLLAAIDMRVAALWLLGLTGFAGYFGWDKGGKWRPALNALVGLGLLFLGLTIVKAGAAPMRDVAAVRDVLSLANGALIPPLALGVLVTLVAQSSSTVSILAITFAAAQLITYDQTVMIVYGASLGSGLSVLLLARSFSGSPRQLVLFQALFKCLGTMLFLLLYVIEHAMDVPLVLALCDLLAADPSRKVGWLFLMLQLCTALALTPFTGILLGLIARFSPPSASEDLSRPAFINEQAQQDAPTALDLAEREQERLIARFPAMLEGVIDGGGTGDVPRPVLSGSSEHLEREIAEFLKALMEAGLERETLDHAVGLNARNVLLTGLRETVDEFATTLESVQGRMDAPPLISGLAEALHTLLWQMEEATRSRDTDDIAMLLDLTRDRGEMMQALRSRAVAQDAGLAYDLHDAVFRASALFERAVWLLRRLAFQVQQAPGADLEVESPAVTA
ncbi:Na/Pi symporter [Terrihabitans rhizophilus]|uniref:Na/Pi symporter n=1 Tax=Terrihabitans rhizophilus TaxID=3092662 RepID=A0ABU4RN28_9HYPH|nr:Na/Pi symporter [Terrihabitans sp. PJ23]MDX6806222.1 Na/Pi symporter [Terrihabitans sp. PJ23]